MPRKTMLSSYFEM